MMSKEKKREVRVWTWSCALLGGLCVLSAMAPEIERVLNIWIGIPALAASALFVLAAFGRDIAYWVHEKWEQWRG